MIKAVLFDLDGTLTDTLPDLYKGVNYALEAHGIPVVTKEKVRLSIGNGISKLIERVTEGYESQTADVEKTFREYYGKIAADTRLYGGIEDLLLFIKDKNVKTAIVSNKMHSAVVDIKERLFTSTIDFAVGVSDDIPVKPAPDGCFKAFEFFRVAADECIFVGDSDVDVFTARNAGIKSIGVAYGYRGREHLEKAGADYVVDTVSELKELISSFLNG